MEFDLENPLTSHHGDHSDTSPSLFLVESDHMPSFSYSKSVKTPAGFAFSFRRQAVSSILQVSCCFDPFLSYLAVNYLDRFLSHQGMPGNANRGGIMFDTETIHRMEALILGALKWRMRSVTPFSFLSFFIHYFQLKDPPLIQALRARATETILRAQNEGKMVGFKPSLIAASALLSACHELFPLQFSCYRDAILSCSYVNNKEMMLESYKEMQELAMEEYESVMDRVSSSDTPVNLLHRHFFRSSSSSEEEEEEMKQSMNGTIDIISTAAAAAAASSTTSSSISSSCSDGGTIRQVEAAVDDIMMTMAINNRNKSKRRKITAAAATNYCNNNHDNDATPEISQRLSDTNIAPYHHH
ncbi:unnamed protein product [Linum tenue]|uniref:Cyclin C-terminal domain-containing protein n=1 Tax=Linum tenue TaxID=586396 RepID=A0AAV0NR03_9ROSI|nr:unnamed protein product [Linum tenue]